MNAAKLKISVAKLLEDPRIVRLRSALPALFIVGGTVRDLLQEKTPNDLDLASPLLPDELIELCRKESIPFYETGLKHQTLTMIPVTDAEPVEITTFRAAGMSPAGGVVQGKSIEEDLAYRDFTINAMAIDVHSGSIVDPFGGTADFEKKVLRCVGSAAERFGEDPLRVMRMLRFAAQLDFQIDETTAQASHEHLDALAHVSIERFREEFSKLLICEHPARGLRLMAEHGVLQIFLPEIQRFVGYEQNSFHKADLFVHTIEVVSKTAPDIISRLAALFHDVGKPETLSVGDDGERHFYKHEHVGAEMTQDILLRLRYPKHTARAVSILVATHMRPLLCGLGGVRRILRDTEDQFDRWRELKYADATSCKIGEEEIDGQFAAFDAILAEVRRGPEVSPLKNLALSGEDLLALGLKQGPEIGEILRELHEHVLDAPEDNQREVLIELAKKRIG
ncbi:MAG: HDIG domain-containing protein [Bdellovibrionales bacterium]|nr:HDIG domain-containing protein [Bdellovibrionales bacterium]